jgi:autoinducer 2 (AI-2) kinase
MDHREPYFAALDYGTGGGKCALFDADGRCMAVARQPWSYRSSPSEFEHATPGFAFDPHGFWAALATCTRKAIAEAGVPASNITAVATTAQRLGTVFLDARGREIYAAPNMDGRGLAGGFEALTHLDRESTVRITGHWPPFVSSLARFLWYRSKPEHPRIQYILTLNDWIAYRLSGALASEPSNAGESLFLDVAARSWSAEILRLFDIDEALLPPVVEPGTRIGRVTAEAAEHTGLLAGTQVFAGGADTQCALLGSGVIESGHAGAVLGTTAPVMLATDRPVFDPSGRLWTGCHVLPRKWTIESNASDTGIAYEWLLEMLGLDGDDGFAIAEDMLAALPPEPPLALALAGPQIFDLDNMNIDRPHGFLFRQRPFSGRPQRATFLKAMLASVACAIRANLEQIEAVRGEPVHSLTLSGGMTRSPTLLTLIGQTVRAEMLVSEELNATALGAAALAAVGSGAYESIDSAVAAMARRRRLEANRDHCEAYDRYHARWCEFYGQLARQSFSGD